MLFFLKNFTREAQKVLRTKSLYENKKKDELHSNLMRIERLHDKAIIGN